MNRLVANFNEICDLRFSQNSIRYGDTAQSETIIEQKYTKRHGVPMNVTWATSRLDETNNLDGQYY